MHQSPNSKQDWRKPWNCLLCALLLQTAGAPNLSETRTAEYATRGIEAIESTLQQGYAATAKGLESGFQWGVDGFFHLEEKTSQSLGEVRYASTLLWDSFSQRPILVGKPRLSSTTNPVATLR